MFLLLSMALAGDVTTESDYAKKRLVLTSTSVEWTEIITDTDDYGRLRTVAQDRRSTDWWVARGNKRLTVERFGALADPKTIKKLEAAKTPSAIGGAVLLLSSVGLGSAAVYGATQVDDRSFQSTLGTVGVVTGLLGGIAGVVIGTNPRRTLKGDANRYYPSNKAARLVTSYNDKLRQRADLDDAVAERHPDAKHTSK